MKQQVINGDPSPIERKPPVPLRRAVIIPPKPESETGGEDIKITIEEITAKRIRRINPI